MSRIVMSQEGTFRIRIRFSSNSLKKNIYDYSKNQTVIQNKKYNFMFVAFMC